MLNLSVGIPSRSISFLKKPKTGSSYSGQVSAKIKTSNGVIQGYNGVTMVDDKHQIIVGAEAFGEATEYNLLGPIIKVTKENFKAIGVEKGVFKEAKLDR